MFGKIDRLLHPRSRDELDGQGSAGPEPEVRGAGRGPELAKGLGMNFAQSTEWAGRAAEPGEGVIGISNDELRQMLEDRNR